ncbi:MAG TPA: peptide-methionine (S)-S-oxide reductase MsrA [Acetobacteraceae bacterium]
MGGGCFWCLEAVYLGLRGVSAVMSGYSGGHVDNPSYEQVCGKQTGHAEVVQITFDPAEVSYEDLLRVFYTIHDPTTLNRQGNDIGPQYRSVIFTHDEAQREAAEKITREIEQSGIWDGKLVTEIVPLEKFWPAEPEHHDYFNRNPWSGYCRAVVAPKVQKFRKSFSDRLKAA